MSEKVTDILDWVYESGRRGDNQKETVVQALIHIHNIYQALE